MSSLNICLLIVLASIAWKIDASPIRAFTNPLNNKHVDVFFVVDETKSYLTSMQYGLLKTALNTIASDLNPTLSSPRLGLYFYGATTNVDVAVPFETNSSNAFKVKLDGRLYPALQIRPSTLTMALELVDSHCRASCRADVPRVIVILSARLDASANSRIRQLESNRDVTVIVVPLGNINNNSGIGIELATHPEEVYAMPVGDYYQLIMTSSHIASVITDTPRLLEPSKNIYVSTAANGVHHTVQVNTASFTVKGEAIVVMATSCANCPVYASLSQLIPTASNSLQNSDRHEFFASSGYPNSLYYFHVPQGTSRIFVSFQGTGASAVYFTCDVVGFPTRMQHDTQVVGTGESLGMIG